MPAPKKVKARHRFGAVLFFNKEPRLEPDRAPIGNTTKCYQWVPSVLAYILMT